MRTIETIIHRLGYDKSETLFRLSAINTCADLSWYDRKLLHELAPYAFYIANGNILVMFFDDLHLRENIQKKIWNAQIPIVISDEGNYIKIYDGKTMSPGVSGEVELKDIIQYDPELCNETDNFSYWNVSEYLSLDTYKQSKKHMRFRNLLVDNLQYITVELKGKYGISSANKLMLRVLFIRYLIDRGINIGYLGLNENITQSQERFLEIIQDKHLFFKLIGHLKRKFNGNLFEMSDDNEKAEITDSALMELHNFLTAKEELKTGQLCLFPFYDFNIIPIELISNIYETLLGGEKQGKDKAFYTPEYLVDYMVDCTVGKYLTEAQECSILDPSCGSGIFLVKSLQKILERNADDNGYIHDKELLNSLVTKSIYGVDCNEEAVDVTIFSIYITLFDYQNIKNLDDFRLPLLKGTNIICGDFFDKEKMELIEKMDYTFLLGNPPWGKMKQHNYKKYCEDRKIIAQNDEICVAFLEKAQEIGSAETQCCFVIPSKLLYKGKTPSVSLRKRLLANTQIDQVLELSVIRKQIFKGATAPAAVVSFVCKKCSEDHKLEYISLKPHKYPDLFGIIMIEPDDIKYVRQQLLLAHDELWKVLVYGGYWDFELLCDLHRNFQTIGDIAAEHDFIMKKGLQDHEGDGKDASHLLGRKILDSDKAVDHFCLDKTASSIFTKEKIHRPREAEIFEAPYVLFRKGLDCSDYSIRAAYSDQNFLYRETLSCIKGKPGDENILLNICGLLNSSLFAYFNLMIGSSAGIEREQIFLNELLTYPYAYSDELAELSRQIQNDGYSDRMQEKINKCVLQMYGLEDNPFVDYALSIQIPMLCGTYVETKCSVDLIKAYAFVFSNIWDEEFSQSGVYKTINIYPDIKGKFTAMEVHLSFDESKDNITIVDHIKDDIIHTMAGIMVCQLNDRFYQTKSVVKFGEDSFIIVKPIESRNWHPAMAVKDTSQVLNSILMEENK